jgi:hypothetical protein
VRFAPFLSGEFTTMSAVNSMERKLAKHTSVHWRFGGKINPKLNKLRKIVKMEKKSSKMPVF